MQFPVKRRFPLLLVYRLPTLRKPPTIIVVTAGAHELEIFGITDKGAVEGEILQEDLMGRFLIIEGESTEAGTLDFGLWTLDECCMTKPKKSAGKLGHSFDVNQ